MLVGGLLLIRVDVYYRIWGRGGGKYLFFHLDSYDVVGRLLRGGGGKVEKSGVEGCLICSQSGSDCPTNGTNLGLFLKISFSIFCLGRTF